MKRVRNYLRKYAEEILILTGFILILVGACHIQPLAAWFVGGAECIIYAILLGWSKRK
jgi:hypothetical protein